MGIFPNYNGYILMRTDSTINSIDHFIGPISPIIAQNLMIHQSEVKELVPITASIDRQPNRMSHLDTFNQG